MSSPQTTDESPEIHPLIRDRWSPRAFRSEAVEAEKLRQLFEAARWAASSYNEQPWRFIVATSDEPHYQSVLECLVPANQSWASSAPVLGLTIVKEAYAKNGKPNRSAEHDLGLAMGNLSIQATALGLHLHQMGGVDLPRIEATFEVPDGFHPFTGFAVGYLGQAEDLPEPWMRQAETATRQRLPLTELVFGERFGRASSIAQPTRDLTGG